MSNFHDDIKFMIDSYVTSVDNVPTTAQLRRTPRRQVTLDRDPALSENLTDELRWLLIKQGPYQPRDHEDQIRASAIPTNHDKGAIRFRTKWFDDARFSDWLEYSLSTCRAYCFYCRLFADSNRNPAFSRDGNSRLDSFIT